VATPEITIAGSLAPLEDCYQPHAFPGVAAAREIFEETMHWFREGGVDLILFETMGNIDEIVAALQVSEKFPWPVWLSLILKDGHHLLDGSSLEKVIGLAKRSELQAVLLNCNSMQRTREGIETLKTHWPGVWGAYPNLGATPIEPDGTMVAMVPIEIFRQYIQGYIKAGARILGSCCGSTPEHTRLLRSLIKEATE
jgi:homocysteine S-methyltransferase